MGATHVGVGWGRIASEQAAGRRRARTRRGGVRWFAAALSVISGLTCVVLAAGCGSEGGGAGAGGGSEEMAGVPDGSTFDLEAAQPCTWVTDESLQTVFDTTRPEPLPGGLTTTKTCKWEDPGGKRFLQVNVTSPRIYDLTAELATTSEFEGLDRPAIFSPSDVNDGFMVVVKAEDHSLVIDVTGVDEDAPGFLPLVKDVVARSGL